MKISVIGAGYVGLVTAACLADVGNDVVCLDVDEQRIAKLREGVSPIHEPGLDALLLRNMKAGRLQFTTDTRHAVDHGTVLFIAVGTPQDEDGSADLRYVLSAASGIGRHMTSPKVVVDKSTVPVGTAEKVRAGIAAELSSRGLEVPFSVVSNPEFLKEGAAIDDFMRPDRIVIGSDDTNATDLMRELYAPFERNHPKLMIMDPRSAELTKYAANAMLATRISFMNELALLAEKVGADIDMVRRGIGSDPRIGSHFLYAGCGYGGSCFPKDVRALVAAANEADEPASILRAVEDVNARQKQVLINKITGRFGVDLKGRTFALWGLAFKPETDDMREAPSRIVVEELLKRGAHVNAYDPVATTEAQRVLGGRTGVSFAGSALEALQGSDALVIVTEWKEFRSPDFVRMRELLKLPVIFDGRNILDPRAARNAGFEYAGIGRA